MTVWKYARDEITVADHIPKNGLLQQRYDQKRAFIWSLALRQDNTLATSRIKFSLFFTFFRFCKPN